MYYYRNDNQKIRVAHQTMILQNNQNTLQSNTALEFCGNYNQSPQK